jgi:chloramphenicol 3-O-phosphotransferase
MDMSDEDDVKLSPGDVEKVKQAIALVAQATGLIEDIPDDVREEYGDLEDALTTLEKATDLMVGAVEPDDNGTAEAETAQD